MVILPSVIAATSILLASKKLRTGKATPQLLLDMKAKAEAKVLQRDIEHAQAMDWKKPLSIVYRLSVNALRRPKNKALLQYVVGKLPTTTKLQPLRTALNQWYGGKITLAEYKHKLTITWDAKFTPVLKTALVDQGKKAKTAATAKLGKIL